MEVKAEVAKEKVEEVKAEAPAEAEKVEEAPAEVKAEEPAKAEANPTKKQGW